MNILYYSMEGEEILQETNLLDLEQPKKFLATPELVQEWKKYYLKGGHTVHSMITYYNYIKRFVDYGIEINQKTVDRFRNKDKNISGACSGALKNFFAFLVDKKDFPNEIGGIKFQKSKSTKKFPKSISPLEVQRVIDSMPTLVDKMLTKTIYELGLRISEGLRLIWEDFNWTTWLQNQDKQGTVNLKQTKGGKFRAIPVSPELMKELYENHKLRNSNGVPMGGLVFNYGISDYQDITKSKEENQYDYIVGHAEDRYRKLLYKVSKSVLGKRINPHQLRHTKAQDMMNKGVPLETIQAFLGHSSITSTQIYAHASADKIAKDLEEYNKIK